MQQVERISMTRRFLDRTKNPPEYVDEELPTKTVRIFSRNKIGTLFDPAINTPGTPLVVGSIQFSGSHYDFAPGSYALRILRRSVYIGSVEARNTSIEWLLRHSREGTVDGIPFYVGTHTAYRLGVDRPASEVLGGPMNPIYAFGPGTVWAYFHRKSFMHGTFRVYSSLEGVF